MAARTILVVEDDSDLRDLMVEVIGLWGHRAIPARHGKDAWDYLQRGEVPDLVILDLMMPVMSGWELRERMLREPRLEHIPLLVLTGVADVETEAAEVRADASLAKPFTIASLQKLVARFAPPRA